MYGNIATKHRKNREVVICFNLLLVIKNKCKSKFHKKCELNSCYNGCLVKPFSCFLLFTLPCNGEEVLVGRKNVSNNWNKLGPKLKILTEYKSERHVIQQLFQTNWQKRHAPCSNKTTIPYSTLFSSRFFSNLSKIVFY